MTDTQRTTEYWESSGLAVAGVAPLAQPLAADDAIDIKQALLFAAAPTNDPEMLAKGLIAAFAIVDAATQAGGSAGVRSDQPAWLGV